MNNRTTLYEVKSNFVLVYENASFASNILGKLPKGAQIEVLGFTNQWVCFIFNGNEAYIRKSSIKLLTTTTTKTGSVTIKYLNVDNNEISTSDIYNNLQFGTYTYQAKAISGYTANSPTSQSVTLDESNTIQTITFFYEKILGKVAVEYINAYTNEKLLDSEIYENLELGSYNYNAKTINDYSLVSEQTISVTLTETNLDVSIVFEYKPSIDADINEVPYIATRYVTPTFDINDDVIINFYVTDWNQSDVIGEKIDIQFNVDVRINDVSKIYTRSIGENSINLGKLNEGEYELILQATDKFGRKSHELYNEFRVIDKNEYDNNILNNTHIITDDELLIYNINKYNSIDNAHNTKVGIQNLINDLAKSGVRKAVLPLGTYRVDSEYTLATNEIQYIKNPITIPSNFILDLNKSTFKQDTTPLEQDKALIFALDYSYDSHIINGIIEGDYGDRDITQKENGNPSGEQVGCGTIAGDSKYSSYENLIIRKFCGYAMITGLSPLGIHAITQEISSWEQGDIDLNGNLDTSIQEKFTSNFIDLSKFKNEKVIRSGKYLGYLFNPDGNSWIVKYSFYNSSKDLISTVIGHQYRDVRKPDNATYLRCTYLASDSSSLSGIMIIHYFLSRNCEFKNIVFEDTRTCALAPFQGNNILIDTCTFARCATNITPVAIDFEDGWHNMQDYCVQNCEILEAVGTSDLVIVGGLDLIFRNNTNWRISSRGCSRGQVFKDNILSNINLGLTSHLLSAFTIFKNNTILGSLGNGLGSLSDIKLVIDNCIFKEKGYQNYNTKIIVRDCTFNWNNKVLKFAAPVIGGTFLRCTFNDFNAGNIHISNINLTDCTINNMNMYLQGNFILNRCTINKCSLKSYTIDLNIDFSNGCIINDFTFSKTSWANCNIIFKSIGSTFNNSTTSSLIDDSFAYFGNTKTFRIITSDNIYLNNTILANYKVLNNSNIDFSEAN